ncbi:MAG: hypothetical protein Q8O72_09150 [Bacteroidales bacterium]|nr:hypothetical protein [Bacteroidales bacterium]
MKKILFSTILIASLMLFPVFSFASDGPGDPGGTPGGGDVPIGGGAPIGGGSLILIGLAAAYGAKKLYEMKKEELEE